jgi:CelD/BcsL family acetyltransferase involved in cellulose biosynthesis
MNRQSNGALTVHLEPIKDLAALERIWAKLDQSGSHSFFVTWTWMGSWLRSLPSLDGISFLQLRRGDEIVGAAVLAVKAAKFRRLIPIRQAWLNASGNPDFDCVTIEHNGLASNWAWADDIWPALESWFATNPLKIDELVLPGAYPAIVPHAPILALDRHEKGFRLPLAGISPTAGIGPALTRNSRQQLNRAIRFFERLGPLAVKAAPDQVTALDFFNHMKVLHTASWRRRGQPGAFGKPFFEHFCRELIAAGLPSGNVDMLQVAAGDTVLGYLFNLHRHGTIYNYQSGFDDADRATRPGYACHALAIAHYAARESRYYDFLAKPNQLKQSFGSEIYELCWRHLRQPTYAFRLEHWARQLVQPAQTQA